jgi:hypothetical protein
MNAKKLAAAAAAATALAGLAACSAAATSHDVAAQTPTAAAAAATSAPPTAPAANPKGNVSANCDVSLSDSMTGQDYLTASVTSNNTGNVGIVTRITVFWPLQGFPSIHRSKTVRTGFGQSREVQFRAPVSVSQVSAFQDEQLASNSGNPCHYRAVITSHYGAAH